MPLYGYAGGILGAPGGLAGSGDCCCDGAPPISCGFCGYSWDVESQAWIGPIPVDCIPPCACLEVALPPPEDPLDPSTPSVETPCLPP